MGDYKKIAGYILNDINGIHFIETSYRSLFENQRNYKITFFFPFLF